MSRRWLTGLYLGFCGLCLAALATPAVLGGRLEPRVLGMPFALWWNIAWLVLAFVALAAFHVLAGGERDP